MILTLIKIRLMSTFSNVGKRDKKRSGAAKVLIGILAVYCVICFFAIFAMMFDTLARGFYAAGLDRLYFSMAGIIAFALCFIGSVFTTSSQVFSAKDNELLLSMPIKPGHIVLSRVLSVLLLNYVFELFVVAPAGVVWIAVTGQVTAAGVICYVIGSLFLGLLSLAFSSILGYLVAIISSRTRRKNLVSTVLSLAFLAVYFYAYSHIQQYMQALVVSGAHIYEALRSYVPPAYHFGVAAADGSFLSLLIFIVWAVVPFVVAYLLISRGFIRVATTNRGAARVKYRERTLKATGVRGALLKKELHQFVTTQGYLLNSAMGSILSILLTVYAIIRHGDIINILGQFLPGSSVAGILTVLLCFCAAMNLVTAPSISLEGPRLWIVRSMPIAPADILGAKALCHIVTCAPVSAVCAVAAGAALGLPAVHILLAAVSVCVMNVFFALLGLIINLALPKMNWINVMQAIKQSSSVGVTMLVSMLIAIAVAVPCFVFAGRLDAGLYMAAIIVLFAGISAAMWAYLRRGGCRRLENL